LQFLEIQRNKNVNNLIKKKVYSERPKYTQSILTAICSYKTVRNTNNNYFKISQIAEFYNQF